MTNSNEQANHTIIIIDIYTETLNPTTVYSTISSVFSTKVSTTTAGTSIGFYIPATSITIGCVLTMPATNTMFLHSTSYIVKQRFEPSMCSLWTVMANGLAFARHISRLFLSLVD